MIESGTMGNDFELADNPFKYIPYVSLSEAWTEAKTSFKATGCLSLMFGVGALADFFFAAAIKDNTPTLPSIPWWNTWFTLLLVLVLLSWFCRGEVIHFRIPRQSFKTWVAIQVLSLWPVALLNISNGLFFAFAFYFNIFAVQSFLATLNSKGFESFKRRMGES